jgi:hypothetical protein
MYASASTWLFNVARQLHNAAGAGPVATQFVSGRADFSGFDDPSVTRIVKSHEISDEPTLLDLARRTTRILVTMRDPRDAATSLMRYHGYDFAAAKPLIEQAARLCMGFARDRRAMLLHFESGFAQSSASVARVAAHLGYPPDPDAEARIFAAHQRQEIEKHIAGLDRMPGALMDPISGDRLDPHTHWHTHHAGRDGEIGRWRRVLSPAQAASLSDALADCYDFVP